MTNKSEAWLQEVLRERLGLPIRLCFQQDRSEIHLSGSAKSIIIHSRPLVFTRNDSDLPFTVWDPESEGWSSPTGQPLPAPGVNRFDTPVIRTSSAGSEIYYDLIGLVFWMLTRMEEIGRTDLDPHGRFPAGASHAKRHRYLNRPIVDEWLTVLRQVAQSVWPDAAFATHHFGMQVSHDIDIASRYGFLGLGGVVRALMGDTIVRRQWSMLTKGPRSALASSRYLHPSDPYNFHDWLMNRAEERNLISTHFFMAGCTDRRLDARYRLDDAAIVSLMRAIDQRGHRVGLHPSYHTYLDRLQLRAEADRLRSTLRELGIVDVPLDARMHFLRSQLPFTWEALAFAGIETDHTLGYADEIGFRAGTCFNYPAFNPVSMSSLPLRIQPLLTMDVTLLHPSYMAFDSNDRAIEAVGELIEACRSVSGTFSLLWHNSELRTSQLRELYLAVLDAGVSSQALRPDARSQLQSP